MHSTQSLRTYPAGLRQTYKSLKKDRLANGWTMKNSNPGRGKSFGWVTPDGRDFDIDVRPQLESTRKRHFDAASEASGLTNHISVSNHDDDPGLAQQEERNGNEHKRTRSVGPNIKNELEISYQDASAATSIITTIEEDEDLEEVKKNNNSQSIAPPFYESSGYDKRSITPFPNDFLMKLQSDPEIMALVGSAEVPMVGDGDNEEKQVIKQEVDEIEADNDDGGDGMAESILFDEFDSETFDDSDIFDSTGTNEADLGLMYEEKREKAERKQTRLKLGQSSLGYITKGTKFPCRCHQWQGSK